MSASDYTADENPGSSSAGSSSTGPTSTGPTSTGRSILPGDGVIGMIGGGQLGRYTLIAARQMGYRTMVLDPDGAAPAGAIADRHIVAAYDDPAAIDELAENCDVVTAEFENPPATTLARLGERTVVAPNARAFEIAQDRIREKTFCATIGVATGPWWRLRTDADLAEIIARNRAPSEPLIVKTARMGYDGKGQRRIAGASELAAAWDELDRVACTVEVALELITEVSVIVARTPSGEIATYPITENHHRDGILDLSIAPARIAAAVADSATEVAHAIAHELDFVGVLAVEFFVVATDRSTGRRVLVNEIAPRPHNSGHWTLNAAACSQFEQQVRAVCGLALGSPELTQPGVAMVNLLGDLWAGGEPNWPAALGPNSALHLYGKAHPRPGRKMGHLTVWDDLDAVADAALRLRSALRPPVAD